MAVVLSRLSGKKCGCFLYFLGKLYSQTCKMKAILFHCHGFAGWLCPAQGRASPMPVLPKGRAGGRVDKIGPPLMTYLRADTAGDAMTTRNLRMELEGIEMGQQPRHTPAGGIGQEDQRGRGRYTYRGGLSRRAPGARPSGKPCDRQGRGAPAAPIPWQP